MTRFCAIALAVVLLGNGTTLAEPDKEPQKKPTAQKAQGQKKAAINAKLEGLFKSFDEDGSGELDSGEFVKALKTQLRFQSAAQSGSTASTASEHGEHGSEQHLLVADVREGLAPPEERVADLQRPRPSVPPRLTHVPATTEAMLVITCTCTLHMHHVRAMHVPATVAYYYYYYYY